MPARPSKAKKSPAVTGRRIAAKSKAAAGIVKGMRIDDTGLTSRVRGHVSARGKRAQAKRDAR